MKLFIVDIDGCIMPSIYPNKTYNGQKELQSIVEKINKENRSVEIYQEFIAFYEEICKNHNIFFVTGRQASNFKELTEYHLSKIKYDRIIYYPETALHIEEFYLNWKIESIISLIEKYVEKNNTIEVFIFDDIDDYFPELEKLIIRHLKIKYYIFSIQKPDDWMNAFRQIRDLKSN